MDRYQRRVLKLREHVLNKTKKEEIDNENEEPINEEEINYDELTVKELKEIAKERGLENYSDLKKDELIAALKGE